MTKISELIYILIVFANVACQSTNTINPSVSPNTVVKEEARDYYEVVMDDITSSIAKTKGQHFIQVEVVVHLSNVGLTDLFALPENYSKTLVNIYRANIIDILRTSKFEELDGSSDQKKKLQNDIMHMMNNTNEVFAPEKKGKIVRIFFSKYTLQ